MVSTLTLRVAARFQRLADAIGNPEELIRKFEVVIDALSRPEKSLPVILAAENLWNTEGKLWSYEDIKRMRAESDPQLETVKLYQMAMAKLAIEVSNSSILFQRAEASYLFLGLLQQYDLSPKLRKLVEAAAKYHGSSRRTPKREVAISAYTNMMSTVRGHLAVAKEALALGKPRGQTQLAEELRAGPFRIVNTGGFDEKTMKEAQAVVGKAAQLLAAKGLQKVLYGDVLVSRTLSRQNILAFYLIQKDEMFVRANLRGKQHDAVRTICHELGHRLHFKFLKDKDAEIRGIYAQLAGKSDRWTRKEKVQEVLKEHPVLKGDAYIEKGENWTVTNTDWDPRTGLVVRLERRIEDSPAVMKAKISLEGYLTNKGLLTHQDLSAFVTPYAKRNHEENFAEMIAFWAIGKLPEDQVEMLKTVL
jgi:hypothetical protein